MNLHKIILMGLAILALAACATGSAPALEENAGRAETASATTAKESEALDYFTLPYALRGETADSPAAAFTVRITIGYAKGAREIGKELSDRAAEIGGIVLRTLSKKTGNELSREHADELQAELKTAIIRILRFGKINTVRFDELSVGK